jgi:hypothetical protein
MKTMNRNLKCANAMPALGVALSLIVIPASAIQVHASTAGQEQKVTLNGTAAGGVMSLVLVGQLWPASASIQTTSGESAESVVGRMAEEINRSDPFGFRSLGGFPVTHSGPEPKAVAAGNTLSLPGSEYVFTGSDRGFAMLKPILSFSGCYDSERQQVTFHWINPTEHYNEIKVSGLRLPPGKASCSFDWKGNETNSIFPYWLGAVLKRGQLSSPPASINLRVNSQEELDPFPFYMGIAPNWSAWSDSDKPDVVKLEQGTKPYMPPKNFIEGPEAKPFYQIIKTTQMGVQGGVYRRFLGLRPRHTYKVEVRLNTLKMDTITNDWVFSFHAAYDHPDGTGLTTAQLAGSAALSDGSKGPAAGRVALYGPGVTTKEKWVKRSTSEPGPGLEIKNITLPPGVTSITVWLRHSGANSTGVGMDWIRLEDVTVAAK